MALINWFLCLSIFLAIISESSSSSPSFFYSFCSNTTMFNPNSTYQTNLNTLFRSLTSNATNPTGFYATSAGKYPDNTIYGSFLCRGDLTPDSCRNCVSTATDKDLPSIYCPNMKVAYIWYDECMVRYSNESFLNKMEMSPAVLGWNPQNVTGNNVTGFRDTMEDMMNVVAEEAAVNTSGKKFGVNITSFTSFQQLYGTAQCTPDLTNGDCYQCLQNAISGLPTSKGGRYLQPSCNVRYESFPFFNGASDLLSPPPPPPRPLQPPHPGNSTSTTPVIDPPSESKKVSVTVIIAIVALIVTIAIALFILGFCIIKRKSFKKMYTTVIDQTTGEDISTIESIQYDLNVLQCATNNFSDQNKLGEGGFGEVYKGRLTNGQEVAVKKLSKSSSQGIREFKNEVLLVAKLQHRNLVKLLGFCLAGEEKLLVYEYVLNKSLDNFLFDPEKRGQLDWGMRHKIIQGIARGMLYLHHDSRLTIIHRDLKASNVLLDINMNPKISDFGMARIFGVDQTQCNTSRIVGTYGYMSPEYAMHGQFSTKSDVYSFGVLVLEIISGKRNNSFFHSDNDEYLLSYAWKQWNEGKPRDLVDPIIRDSCSSDEVMRCIHLGLLCVQESINKRPTMTTIVLMLDSNSINISVPEQPIYTIESQSELKFTEDIDIGSNKSSTSKSPPLSVNDVSITELEPR